MPETSKLDQNLRDAVRSENVREVRKLLAAGADPYALDGIGLSARRYAEGKDNSEIHELLGIEIVPIDKTKPGWILISLTSLTVIANIALVFVAARLENSSSSTLISQILATVLIWPLIFVGISTFLRRLRNTRGRTIAFCLGSIFGVVANLGAIGSLASNVT